MSSSEIPTSDLGITINRLFEIVNYMEYKEIEDSCTAWSNLIYQIIYIQPRIDDIEIPIHSSNRDEDYPATLMTYLVEREKRIIQNSKKDPNHTPFGIIKDIQSLYYHLLIRLWTDNENNGYIKRMYIQEIQLGDRSGHMHQFIRALRNLHMLICPYNDDLRWFTVHDATNSVLLYSWRAKGINPNNPTGLIMTSGLVSFTSMFKVAQEFHAVYNKEDTHDECLLVLYIPIQLLITGDNEQTSLTSEDRKINPGCTHMHHIKQIFPRGLIPISENDEYEILVMPGVMLQATPWGPELGDVYMEAIKAIIRETRNMHKCDDFKLDVVGLTYEGYDGTGARPHHHIYTNSRVVYNSHVVYQNI